MRQLLRLSLVIGIMVFFEASAWSQGCSMCRTALESSPEGRVLASSFAQGILMMLFLPYALIGTFGFLVYRAFRKKAQDQQS